MYNVECDGTTIYEDVALDNKASLIDPKLELSDNSAGSFTAVLPLENVGYNICHKMSSTIVVKRDGEWLWEGRILQENIDFHHRKKITCEGALAYLNDTILEPASITVGTMGSLLGQILNRHNSKVQDSRKIFLGAITVPIDDIGNSFEFNYENAFEWIKTNILDITNGHMRIRKDGSILKLDYYKDYPNTSSQEIDFGVNLLDFSKDYDFSNICTVCIPRGKQLDSESDDGSKKTKYLTIADANNNSIYLQNTETVSRYGRIERVVDFSDAENAVDLLKLGHIYMNNLQFEDLILTIKAVDLHFLNPEISGFNLLDRVRCLSLPHGLDKFFPITAISMPFGHPENFEYTMGANQPSSMSGSITSVASAAKSKFNELPTRESVLVEAFRNTNEILSRKTTGFVSIVDRGDHSEALIISNLKDWTASDTYWKFDMNGLGFFKRDPKTKEMVNKGIAITMDGQIVADYITTGTMSADRIRTGIIKDVYNNNVIDLEHGTINLSSERTTITTQDGQKYSLASSKDIGTINGSISSISQQQATFKTDITGLQSDVISLEASYGYCETGSSDNLKRVTCQGFKLYKGAVVVVRFKYRNTSDNPVMSVNNTGFCRIYVNKSPLPANSRYNWGDGETVTFAYDGSYWVISNGATESHIRQLADSIWLRVTGSLGQTASFELGLADWDSNYTIGKSKRIQKSVDLTEVKKAFANDNSYISAYAGRISFLTGSFELHAGNCDISADGIITANGATIYGCIISGNPAGRRMELNNVELRGYNEDNDPVGFIAPSQRVTWEDSGLLQLSFQIWAHHHLRISTPYVSIRDTSDTTATTTVAYSGMLNNIVFDQSPTSDGGVSWHSGDLEFCNGLLVAKWE